MKTTIEQPKDRLIAGAISLGVFALLFLFLLLYKIITPNPPFEFTGEEGMEMNFGTYNEGTGNIENNGIGDATSVVTETAETNPSPTTPPVETKTEETFENGEAIIETPKKPKIEKNTTVITPVKPKHTSTTPIKNPPTNTTDNTPKNTNNSLLNNFIKNGTKSGSNGGDGNSGTAGNDGAPDGNPNTHGLGGHGNNPNQIGNGGGGTGGVSLVGRKIITPPCNVSDSKEEGTVVVTITVNKEGKVTDADPNGRGTTTTSSVLKSKARQAALCAKFSPNDAYDEQIGTITFKFDF